MDKIKAIIIVTLAALTAWLGILAVPIYMLCIVMAMDYLTGVVSAIKHKKLNSEVGIYGIVKKVGYLLLVSAASIVDYLLSLVTTQLSIDFKLSFLFALLVIIWLIVNELISILENLVKWDVPIPIFLTNIINKLKTLIEKKGDTTNV